jgi:hypothetical protein
LPNLLKVLQERRVRFTQPGDFNDPFEFRPQIEAAVTDGEVEAYVEQNFEQLVEQELAKYSALVQGIPRQVLKDLLVTQKTRLPEVFKMLQPEVLQRISPAIDGLLNQNVGVLCFSEVRDSLLMWGHYTDNHKGFVIGFDSSHAFFLKRRSEQDEFGFLGKVNYQVQRPKVVLSDTSSPVWFQTKSSQWEYEKEWRIVRVLSEADRRIDRSPFPLCLFEFAADAILEIVIESRADSATIQGIRSLASHFPRAALLKVRENESGYGLVIEHFIKRRDCIHRIPAGFKSFSPALVRGDYAGSSSKTIFYRNAVASRRRYLLQLLQSRFHFRTTTQRRCSFVAPTPG